jgi:8-oxo-dGTP diphosphatase
MDFTMYSDDETIAEFTKQLGFGGRGMAREMTKIGIALVNGDQLLLVRKRGSVAYILPGGKPERNEDDVAALSREIEEELGCRLDTSSLVFLGSFADKAADAEDMTVTVRLYGGGHLMGNPSPNSEIEEILWFSPRKAGEAQLAPSLVNSIIPFLFQS